MKRPVAIIIGVVLLFSVIVAGIVFGVEKHQRDVAAAAERARVAAAQATALATFQTLSAASSRIDAALAQFSSLKDQYDQVLADAGQASQQRHDLYSKTPNDDADALGYIHTEKDDVGQLESLSEAKANAARAAATAFGDHFGEATTSSLIANISVASEAESKGLTDWLRAANDINDHVTASVNHQYYQSSEDVAALYRTSDEEEAASRSQWDSIGSRMSDLHDRLALEIKTAQDLSNAPSSPAAMQQPAQSAQPAQSGQAEESDIEAAKRLLPGLRMGALPTSVDGKTVADSSYPFELYRSDPTFASAFNTAVKDAEGTPRGNKARWIEGAGGVASPIKLVADQSGRKYIIFSACKPHDCPDGRFYGFYDPGSHRVAAVLYTSDVNGDAANDDIFVTNDNDLPMIQVLRVSDPDEKFPLTAARRIELGRLLDQQGAAK